MHRNNKDRAIVLTLKPLKDAHKLAVLFSQQKGRLSLQVKGASNSLSKLSPNLDGGNLVDISYYKSRSDLDLLLEAKLIEDLSNLKKNSQGIATLLYILEVLNHFIQPELPLEGYFNSISDLLMLINADEKMYLPALAYFQLTTLINFGYAPQLDICSICSQRLEQDEARAPLLDEGIGYRCDKHLSELDKERFIKDNILKVQRYLAISISEDLLPIKLEPKDWNILISLQNYWLQNVIEKKILSFDMIKTNG